MMLNSCLVRSRCINRAPLYTHWARDGHPLRFWLVPVGPVESPLCFRSASAGSPLGPHWHHAWPPLCVRLVSVGHPLCPVLHPLGFCWASVVLLVGSRCDPVGPTLGSRWVHVGSPLGFRWVFFVLSDGWFYVIHGRCWG